MSRSERSLANLHSLAQLAREGGPGLGPAALAAQIELIAQRPPHMGVPDDAVALMLALLAASAREDVLRAAEKLAPLSHVPEIVLDALWRRGGAAALLRAAPWLPAALRRDAVERGEPELARLLALRADVTAEEVANLLAQVEPDVLCALAANPRVTFQREQMGQLLRLARDMPDLAQVLLRHSALDCALTLPLYRHADAVQRRELREALAQRMLERGVTLRERTATPAERERLLEVSLLGMAPLIAEAAVIADRSAAFVEAAAADPTRDVLSLALVALDIPPHESIRMLLRTGDDIARDSRMLAIAVDTLRETPRAVATAILATSWPRAQPAAKPAQHVPAMAPGGTPSRPPSGGAARRGPAVADPIERIRGSR